jgi:hypothetical protein
MTLIVTRGRLLRIGPNVISLVGMLILAGAYTDTVCSAAPARQPFQFDIRLSHFNSIMIPGILSFIGWVCGLGGSPVIPHPRAMPPTT